MRRTAMTLIALFVAALAALVAAPASAGPGAGSASRDARAAAGVSATASGIGVQASWYSGTVAGGATQNWHWNNANPLNASHLVGLSPLGASSTPCQFEVTRTWYVQQPGGEREFHFTVKNVGTITCTTDIRLASTTTSTSWSTGTLAAGAQNTWHWNNANPLDLVYLPGLSPLGASGSTACQLEVTREWYVQRINTDGSAEREFYFTVRNPGSLSCSGTILLASIAS